MSRKADMAIGTLIILISMLLVVAIAAGVLFQTTQSLSEKSAISGEQTRQGLSTHVIPISLTGTSNSNNNISMFELRVKTAPGSSYVNLEQSVISFGAGDSVATLSYRGTGSACRLDNSNGYNTFTTEELGKVSVHNARKWTVGGWVIVTYTGSSTDLNLDFDNDGTNDTVMTCYSGPGGDNCPASYLDTYLKFNLSTDGIIYVPLLNDNGTLSNLNNLDGFDITHQNISTYGYFSGYRPRGSAAGRLSEAGDPCTFQIYKNPQVLEEDLDDDGASDYLVLNHTHIQIQLSNTSNISIPLSEALTGGNTLNMNTTITDGTDVFGTLIIQGTTTIADQIDEGVTFQVVPENYGKGYYCAVYDHQSTNWMDGVVQEGDIVKFCFEPPIEISEDMAGIITLIPSKGSEASLEFLAPEVINEENIELYP